MRLGRKQLSKGIKIISKFRRQLGKTKKVQANKLLSIKKSALLYEWLHVWLNNLLLMLSKKKYKANYDVIGDTYVKLDCHILKRKSQGVF